LFETGNSFNDAGSSASGMFKSFTKNAACSANGHERRIFARDLGDESVTNRVSSTCMGNTLHRPPPLMRIFRPPSRVRSSKIVSAPPLAAKIAAIDPAAPAPMITTFLGERTGLEDMLQSSPFERPVPRA
jgi:hypothetical protein